MVKSEKVKLKIQRGLKKGVVWSFETAGDRHFAFTLTEMWKAESRAKKLREKQFFRDLRAKKQPKKSPKKKRRSR